MLKFNQVGDECEPEYVVQDVATKSNYGMIAWAADETFQFYPYPAHMNLPGEIMEGINQFIEILSTRYHTA